MVSSITSLGRSGVYDWLVQRITAVILAAYTLCLFGTLITNPELGYAQWQTVFQNSAMRLFSLLALLSLCAHAWIGMWTISTDYLTHRMIGSSATVVRFLFQIGCGLLTFVYFVWGIQILWGF
jgi:succinate dehydrogenase / fumarate reductase, membrane anchor subunit